MHKKIILLTLPIAVIAITISESCGGSDQTKQATVIQSQEGETKSHEFGTNCMSCHNTTGKGDGLFTVAGSVLDEARAEIQKKCVVKLYTEPKGQGKLIATISGDAIGNFYTTQEIDFSKGLYPTLLGTPGVKEDTKHMPNPIYSGDCNNCHGLTTEKLGID